MSDWRVYFNRWADDPCVWSVDEGTQDSERNVREIHLHGVSADTVVDPGIPRGDRERPRVWLLIRYATLEIRDNVAHFFRDSNWRMPPIGQP